MCPRIAFSLMRLLHYACCITEGTVPLTPRLGTPLALILLPVFKIHYFNIQWDNEAYTTAVGIALHHLLCFYYPVRYLTFVFIYYLLHFLCLLYPVTAVTGITDNTTGPCPCSIPSVREIFVPMLSALSLSAVRPQGGLRVRQDGGTATADSSPGLLFSLVSLPVELPRRRHRPRPRRRRSRRQLVLSQRAVQFGGWQTGNRRRHVTGGIHCKQTPTRHWRHTDTLETDSDTSLEAY